MRARLARERQLQAVELGPLHFCFPRRMVQFGYIIGESVGHVDLSLADARALVALIEAACRQNDVISVNLQEFSLRVDARIKSGKSDYVTVRVEGSSTTFDRASLLAGCGEFTSIFGRSPATEGLGERE